MVNEKRGKSSGIATCICYGVAACIVTELVLFAILSVFVSKMIIPESLIGTLAAVSGGVGAIVGAITAARKKHGMALTMGLSVGAGMCVLVLVIGAFGNGEGLISGSTVKVIISLLIGGVLGGLFSARPKKKRASAGNYKK